MFAKAEVNVKKAAKSEFLFLLLKVKSISTQYFKKQITSYLVQLFNRDKTYKTGLFLIYLEFPHTSVVVCDGNDRI